MEIIRCLHWDRQMWRRMKNETVFGLTGVRLWSSLLCFCHCSVSQLCPAVCNPMVCSTPGFSVLHCLLDFAQTHVHWVSDAIFSSCLQSFPASGSSPMSRLFASGDQSIAASASSFISPSSEYSGLISFKIDWFDLFAVQGTYIIHNNQYV